jgi:hypothetical protein
MFSFNALGWTVGLVSLLAAAPVLAQQPQPPQQREPPPSWLRIRGEFRERFEGFTNGGFTDDRDDMYWLSRFRLTATMTPGRLVSFSVQAQDARVGDKSIGPTGAPFSGPFDLRAAYGDVGTATSPVAARVGRQELVFGEQRLVGHVGWANTARTFDGARVTFRNPRLQLDVFGASVVRILDHEFDRSGNGNRFIGAYGVSGALIPKSAVEPYVLWKRDQWLRSESGAPGNLEVLTIGVRWAGKLPPHVEYGTEMAVQRGSLGSDVIDAWAGHWQLRTATAGRVPVGLTGEYNYASGDEDPTDGKRGTFDQLYPTGHDKYGLADQVGWRNIHHLRFGIDLTPITSLLLTTNYHSSWLADRRDALYTAGSAVLARVAGGADSRHVGEEIDFQASRPLTPQLQLSGGYAYVFPGRFLKQATPGAAYGYPYVMATYAFLAGR